LNIKTDTDPPLLPTGESACV